MHKNKVRSKVSIGNIHKYRGRKKLEKVSEGQKEKHFYE